MTVGFVEIEKKTEEKIDKTQLFQSPTKQRVRMLVQERQSSPQESPLTESGNWTESGICTAADLSSVQKSSKPKLLDLQDSIDTDVEISDMSPMNVEEADNNRLSPIQSQSSDSSNVPKAAATAEEIDEKKIVEEKQTEVSSVRRTSDKKLSPILFTESKGTSTMKQEFMVDVALSANQSLFSEPIGSESDLKDSPDEEDEEHVAELDNLGVINISKQQQQEGSPTLELTTLCKLAKNLAQGLSIEEKEEVDDVPEELKGTKWLMTESVSSGSSLGATGSSLGSHVSGSERSHTSFSGASADQAQDEMSETSSQAKSEEPLSKQPPQATELASPLRGEVRKTDSLESNPEPFEVEIEFSRSLDFGEASHVDEQQSYVVKRQTLQKSSDPKLEVQAQISEQADEEIEKKAGKSFFTP